MRELFEYLALYGGRIVSSNDLPSELIAQARASNRMYVDENSLGYVWEPSFAGRCPETGEEVRMFEWCYPLPIDGEAASALLFDNIVKMINDRDKRIHKPISTT